jgi:hypothetical protein
MTPMPQLNPTYGDEHISQDTRWWHEWLCRCGEGPDRGGDNQVLAQRIFGEMYWSDCSFLLRPVELILLSKSRALSAEIAHCSEPSSRYLDYIFYKQMPS